MAKDSKSKKTEAKVEKSENTENTNQPLILVTGDTPTKGTSFKKFDVKNFFLPPIDDKFLSSNTHWNTIPKYNESGKKSDVKLDLNSGRTPHFLTGVFEMTRGGIPKFSDKYHKSKNSGKRALVWYYLDKKQKVLVDLFDALTALDDYFNTEINEKKNENGIVTKLNSDKKPVPMKGLQYVRFIRTSDDENDDEEQDDTTKGNTKKMEPFTRFKAKFETEWEKDNNGDEFRDVVIKTGFFVGNEDEPKGYKTVEEFAEAMPWKSVVQHVIKTCKFYVAKTKDSDTKKHKCGFGFKITNIQLIKKGEGSASDNSSKLLKTNIFATGGVVNDYKEDEDLVKKDDKSDSDKSNDEKDEKDEKDEADESGESDDDKDDSDEDSKSKKKTDKKAKKDESDDESTKAESDKDNSDDEKADSKKKSDKKSTKGKKDESDDEDNDDKESTKADDDNSESEAETKKSAKKGKKDESDEESDESDKEPKKKSAKKGKKDESEDEDDESDKEPKKKSAKKGKKDESEDEGDESDKEPKKKTKKGKKDDSEDEDSEKEAKPKSKKAKETKKKSANN